jgi:preprotein translocase subunit SecE
MTKNKKKTTKAQQPEAQAGVRKKLSEFREFFEESKTEMKKVTYPSQKQTLITSGSVFFLVILIAIFLGLVDIALAKIIEVILP